MDTQSSVTPPSRAGWYTLFVLSLVAFFSYMDRMALAILLEPIKAELHLSDGQLGLLTGLAFAALFAICGFPLARLADRRSRVKLLSACLAIWSVTTFLTGAARTFPQIFLARMGVGVGEAGCLPAAHSLLSDLFPRNKRALAISLLQCGGVLGTSIGLFFVGLLGEAYGWRHTLQVIGLAGIPLALLMLLTVKEPPRPPLSTSEAAEPLWQSVRALLGRRAYCHLILAYGLSTICTAGITQWVPSFLTRSFGMGMAQVGAWAGAATGVGGVIGLITGGLLTVRLVQRDPRWELWLPAITCALSAPFYAAAFLGESPVTALILKSMGSYIAAIGGGVTLAALQAFAEPRRRATAVAIAMFCSSLLGMGLGPYLVGVASDALAPTFGKESLRYALLAATAILLWATLHFLLSSRHANRDRV